MQALDNAGSGVAEAAEEEEEVHNKKKTMLLVSGARLFMFYWLK